MLSNKSDSKSVWKAINQLTNKKYAKSATDTIDVPLDEINDHFANIAEQLMLKDSWKNNDLDLLKEYCSSKNITSQTSIPFLSLHEVLSALTHLKHSNTKDIHGLDANIIRTSAPVIADTLTYIYNLCIDKHYIPHIFKQAKVIPIFKSGDSKNPSNYRPISILSILSKPLEKHIQKHLLHHINKYNLVHPNQSGFREKHSCHTALTQMIDKWLININNNNLTGVVFVDFTKAFDIINHSLLLNKLKLYGFSKNTVQLISSFLSDRRQSVCINTHMSSPKAVKFGVPQGSILGPLLFTLYINDLPLSLEATCELFADDNSIHTNHPKVTVLNNYLQQNIDKLIQWTELNHMRLNESKTKCMNITTRQKRQNMSKNSFSVSVSGAKIEEVQSHKVLGIMIDNNLSWSQHLSFLCKKVSQKIFQLSKIKHFLNLHSRKLFFLAHIQSAIDYASTIWDSASAKCIKPLSRLYKRGLKLTMLKSSALNATDYKSIDILPLSLRFEYNKAVIMHKVVTGYSPPTILNSFKINEKRHKHKIVLPLPRIDLFKSSLSYSGGLYWNNLPDFLKNINDIKNFKVQLKKYLFSKISKNYIHT